MESEDSLASTGLVFIPEGRVLYTSSVQIIPIQVERSRLTGPLLELQSWLQDVDKRLDNIQLSSTVQDDRNRVGAMTSDLRSPIIGGLKTMVRQMSDEIDHQTSVIRDFFFDNGRDVTAKTFHYRRYLGLNECCELRLGGSNKQQDRQATLYARVY